MRAYFGFSGCLDTKRAKADFLTDLVGKKPCLNHERFSQMKN